MGSEDGEADMGPVHSVLLEAFWIYLTEVTNGQYVLCVQDGDCEALTYSDYDQPEQAPYPVVRVSWDDASAYCDWAGGRLPTEAEWEKAARGEDERTFPWGEGIDCERANYSGCLGELAPAASYSAGASPYGALNMAGNVWEWVADWYAADYYQNSPWENPAGPPESDIDPARVLRGGSYEDTYIHLWASFRWHRYTSVRADIIGFRCVVPVPGD
jgi:formylglycine-generating enzyme required for sulfatase activity